MTPSTLPLEAAGRLLWQRLLGEPPDDDESRELESEEDGEPEEDAA
jgi:hypothetical protein